MPWADPSQQWLKEIEMPKNLPLATASVNFGADPELFVTKIGKKSGKPRVVGSERIINENMRVGIKDGWGTVVPDGVQAELHPHPTTCRAGFSSYVSECLVKLHEHAIKNKLSLSFDQVVTVGARELSGLSHHAKHLGCSPSINFYGRLPKEVDGMIYRRRSAAGHIHLGTTYISSGVVKPESLVPLLDILVGVPSVLMDRDPKASERRKLYGRAGEYRLPEHGLEYRTLSNFWLTSYQVMSLVLAQARMAVDVAYSSTPQAKVSFGKGIYSEAEKDLREAVGDLAVVEKIINKNDYDGAFKLFQEVIKPWGLGINQYYAGIFHNYPTPPAESVKNFEYFVSKPLSEWFPTTQPSDVVNRWINERGYGWETYSQRIIQQKRLASAKI
jgi:hypothetical protein